MDYVKPIVSTLSRANIGGDYAHIRLSSNFLLNIENIFIILLLYKVKVNM